jgi:hypothetical protein
MRFDVSTAATVVSTVLWNVALCSLSDAYRRFGVTCPSTLKLVVVSSSDAFYVSIKVELHYDTAQNILVHRHPELEISPCLIIQALCHNGIWGSGGTSPLFLTSALDGVECQLHATATVDLWKEPL